jgi:hypothetical protein
MLPSPGRKDSIRRAGSDRAESSFACTIFVGIARLEIFVDELRGYYRISFVIQLPLEVAQGLPILNMLLSRRRGMLSFTRSASCASVCKNWCSSPDLTQVLLSPKRLEFSRMLFPQSVAPRPLTRAHRKRLGLWGYLRFIRDPCHVFRRFSSVACQSLRTYQMPGSLSNEHIGQVIPNRECPRRAVSQSNR